MYTVGLGTQKTDKREKFEMHTVGHGIWQEN